MRKIAQNLVLTTGQTAKTDESLYPGMRAEGWRLFDAIIRVKNRTAGATAGATVGLYSTVTDELIGSAAVIDATGKSSDVFKLPGEYYILVDTVLALGADLDIYIDGDTGRSVPITIT